MAEVIALHRTANAVFASFHETFLVVWRTATTVPLVRAMGRHVERFAASHPDGISMVVVVEEGCQMPDAPTREVMAVDMKRHESFTRHMALVYSSVADAAAWLASQPTPNATADEIVAAVAEARSPR